MKRALIVSLILHLILLVVVFFLKPADKEKEKRPIIAQIVTPEKPAPEEPQKKQKKAEQQKPTRSPRIKDKEPPKVMSQSPSQKAQKKRQGTARKRELAQKPATTKPDSPEATRKPHFVPQGYGIIKPPQQKKSDHDQLFDPDAIARATRRPEKQKEDDSITFDTKDFKYYGYMQRLREKIEYTWKFPAEAGERRIAGEVYIRFTISKNGKLTAADVVRTSGYRILDDAAVRALRDADPYWPLPEEWKRNDLTITGRFIYSVREQRIR